jgi:hypothetical protein
VQSLLNLSFANYLGVRRYSSIDHTDQPITDGCIGQLNDMHKNLVVCILSARNMLKNACRCRASRRLNLNRIRLTLFIVVIGNYKLYTNKNTLLASQLT